MITPSRCGTKLRKRIRPGFPHTHPCKDILLHLPQSFTTQHQLQENCNITGPFTVTTTILNIHSGKPTICKGSIGCYRHHNHDIFCNADLTGWATIIAAATAALWRHDCSAHGCDSEDDNSHTLTVTEGYADSRRVDTMKSARHVSLYPPTRRSLGTA